MLVLASVAALSSQIVRLERLMPLGRGHPQRRGTRRRRWIWRSRACRRGQVPLPIEPLG
jgi:hypothetical protein